MAVRTLTLAFVSPTETDHWLNRLTGYASQHNLCHVELHFEPINMCFSIVYGETAGLRFKQLSNPNYKLISLAVTKKEYDDCLSFCQSAGTWKLGFDNHGMWYSYFTCCSGRSSQLTGSTFCSKIIAEALQFGGIAEVEHINPCAATPSRLYEAVRRSQRIICNSVPYKRSALVACGSI